MADECLIVKGPMDQWLPNYVERKASDEYDAVSSMSPNGYELDRNYFTSYIADIGQAIERVQDGKEIDVLGFSLGGSFAREAVEAFDNQEKVENIVTWNSPYKVPEFTEVLGGLIDIDLAPGSNWMGNLSLDEPIANVNYINVYSADNPLIMNEDNFRLPEKENVENLEIGSEYLDIASEMLSDTANVAGQWIKTSFGLVNMAVGALTNPENVQENWADFLEEMTGGVEKAAEVLDVEAEDVHAGHFAMMFNQYPYEKAFKHKS